MGVIRNYKSSTRGFYTLVRLSMKLSLIYLEKGVGEEEEEEGSE